MRRRSSVLPLAVAVMLLGSGAAAAQDPAPPPAVAVPPQEAPAPVQAAPPAADPATPPATEPEAVTAAPPSPPPSQPATEPPPPTPPEAEPAPVAVAAAPASAERPARSRRQRPRAPNREQADVAVDLYGGRVTIRTVPRASCPSADLCDGDPPMADYEVRDLEVRAERDGPALITVKRAAAGGPADGRRIEVDVVLRPPDGAAAEGRLRLKPEEDVLDRGTYEGSGLEDVIGDVLEALRPLTRPGGVLAGLKIRFGPGLIDELRGAAAVGISTDDGSGRVVYAPLERGGTVHARSIPDGGDAGGDAQDETGEVLGEGDEPEGDEEPRTGGGGPATAVFGFLDQVGGAVATGICEARGGTDCEPEQPARPRFTVDALTAVLFVDAEGRGAVQVRCPAGYEDVTGELGVWTEIRIGGEASRRLAGDVTFRCDEPVEEVRVRLRPGALEQLEQEETLDARITVIVSVAGDAGLTDGDANELVRVRLRSRER